MDGGAGGGQDALVLDGQDRVPCGGTHRRGVEGDREEVDVHHGQRTQTFKQAGPNGFEARPHALALTGGEGVSARRGRVVHVVFKLGAGTCAHAARRVLRGGGGVAHEVALRHTVVLF